VPDFALAEVKSKVVYIEMAYILNSRVQSQNYLGLCLSIPCKAERTHSTTTGMLLTILCFVLGGVDN
jgi:hypothetical protein